jgi:hypothetical protein
MFVWLHKNVPPPIFHFTGFSLSFRCKQEHLYDLLAAGLDARSILE